MVIKSALLEIATEVSLVAETVSKLSEKIRKLSETTNQDQAECLLPIKDAAEMLGVSMTTMRHWDETGRLKAVRATGREKGHRSYPLSKVQRLIEEIKEEREREAIRDLPDITEEGRFEDASMEDETNG